MSQGTKKAGRAGRLGARYGTSVRRRVANIERVQFKSHRCPECLTGELKRVSTSIWRCRKCEHKFAGGAYVPRTEAFGKAQAPAEELEELEEAFEEEAEEPEEPAVPEPEPEAEDAEPEAEAAEPEAEEAEEPVDEADEAPESPEAPEAAEDEDDEDEPRDIGTLFED